MFLHTTPALLGRYAVLQDSIFTNLAEGTLIGDKKRAFFKRFARSPLALSRRNNTESEKLINITEGAHEIFLTAKTVFPFVLFPDTINIDRQKLTIVHRTFFRVAKIASLQVRDITNVEASVGPLFGSVTLTSKHFLNNTQTISFLRRGDIVKIQRLIQGLMIADHAGIDTADIEKRQLVILLNDLGQGSSS